MAPRQAALRLSALSAALTERGSDAMRTDRRRVSRRARAATLLLAAWLAGPSAAAEVQSRTVTLVHDGVERAAIVDRRPDATGAPMLIGLHGGLAGARTVRRRAAVTLAERGWVVAWPSAIGDWSDGRRDAEGRPFNEADDVGFLRSLVARYAEVGIVDPSRVFVAGPSIGGVMALKLVCDAPDLVAGAAVAIASLPVGARCSDGPPRPVLYIHGADDGIMPPAGGPIGGGSVFARDRGSVRPVAETLAALAARNGCAGFEETRLPDLAPDDDSTVRLRVYEGCSAPLVHYIVDGGGHAWPGGRPSRLGAFIVGATNRDFSATRAVEEFFERLARR